MQPNRAEADFLERLKSGGILTVNDRSPEGVSGLEGLGSPGECV